MSVNIKTSSLFVLTQLDVIILLGGYRIEHLGV